MCCASVPFLSFASAMAMQLGQAAEVKKVWHLLIGIVILLGLLILLLSYDLPTLVI